MRRKVRRPCSCENIEYPGLNPLFSNRADQPFSYDVYLNESEQSENNKKRKKGKGKELPERKPDRVYGLRQTVAFEDLLNKPAGIVQDKVAGDCIATSISAADLSNNEERLVRNLVQASPFHRRGDPLLFPFLILEAKVEEGRGFTNCGVQTSLPIWTLLQGQEQLTELGGPWDELGGPLVWYIAYLGDNWRISGCFIANDKGQKSYVSGIYSY